MAAVVCVIVRPTPIFRAGLTTVLAKSPFKPVWSESSTEELSSEITQAGEQVLLLMAVREGDTLVEALSTAKAMFPDAPVVVVGDSAKSELVTRALASGATTFIDENVATPTLIKKLELVALGEPVISVLILKQLLGGSAPSGEEAVLATPAAGDQRSDSEEEARRSLHLSGREAAILNALVQGSPNKVIACRLNITEATVKVHVKSILRKIQVRNRTQAAIWALHHQGRPAPAHEGNGKVTP